MADNHQECFFWGCTALCCTWQWTLDVEHHWTTNGNWWCSPKLPGLGQVVTSNLAILVVSIKIMVTTCSQIYVVMVAHVRAEQEKHKDSKQIIGAIFCVSQKNHYRIVFISYGLKHWLPKTMKGIQNEFGNHQCFGHVWSKLPAVDLPATPSRPEA